MEPNLIFRILLFISQLISYFQIMTVPSEIRCEGEEVELKSYSRLFTSSPISSPVSVRHIFNILFRSMQIDHDEL